MYGITHIKSGLIEGVPCGNPSYVVYKGIPYAAPPVGPRRWQPPSPPQPWDGVKKCDTFPPMAMQSKHTPGDFYQKEFFPVQLPMSEDCLYLNVWAPATSQNTSNEKCPVMMWIHGGAYLAGYGHEMEFDGEAFCKRGVILVTINYRLGIFGYFAHKSLSAESPHSVSGNYGLLDQIYALKWIKENIHAFGGDPDNVTVFGQSAGGGSVQALISSPLAKGLFSKAIVQSAAMVSLANDSLADAEQLGADICTLSGKDVDALRELPADELFELTGKTIGCRIQKEGSFKLWFSPCADGYVLPESPVTAIEKGNHMDIQYMVGTAAGDYEPIAALDPKAWAENHIQLKRPPIYAYFFNHDIPGEDKPGAFHSSELWYIFGTLARCHRPMLGADYQLSLTMTDYWTNFAKKGNPNNNGLPIWHAYTLKTPEILELNGGIGLL